MRVLSAIAASVLTLVFAGVTMAVPPGKKVEWDGKGLGKVVFDGTVHADKGARCDACHIKIFQMRKGATQLKMDEMNDGKQCGACHDGTKAFSASDKEACVKCHKKE